MNSFEQPEFANNHKNVLASVTTICLSSIYVVVWLSYIYYFIFTKEAQVYRGLAQCHMANIRIQIHCKFFDSRFIILPILQWGCEICLDDIPFIRRCNIVIEAWIFEWNLDLNLAVHLLAPWPWEIWLISLNLNELINKLKIIIF